MSTSDDKIFKVDTNDKIDVTFGNISLHELHPVPLVVKLLLVLQVAILVQVVQVTLEVHVALVVQVAIVVM